MVAFTSREGEGVEENPVRSVFTQAFSLSYCAHRVVDPLDSYSVAGPVLHSYRLSCYPVTSMCHYGGRNAGMSRIKFSFYFIIFIIIIILMFFNRLGVLDVCFRPRKPRGGLHSGRHPSCPGPDYGSH